jgi:hypothetical protein
MLYICILIGDRVNKWARVVYFEKEWKIHITMLYATRMSSGSCQVIMREFADFSVRRSCFDSGEIPAVFVVVNGVSSAGISSTTSFPSCQLWLHLYFVFLPI